MNVHLLYTEVWVCARCNRWAYRCLKIESGSYGPDWQCEKCGCTSVYCRGEGRPIGPRSPAFKREVRQFIEFFKVTGLHRSTIHRYAKVSLSRKKAGVIG